MLSQRGPVCPTGFAQPSCGAAGESMIAPGYTGLLPPGDTDGVKGLCLEPHDLVIARYVARRDKDIAFNRELARRKLVTPKRLLDLLAKTPVTPAIRERIRRDIANDFAR
jgi:hypothetical protein